MALNRIKKSVQSSAMNTSIGRSIVVDALPPMVQAMLDAAKAAISKYDDHEQAKEVKKDLLKLALKLRMHVADKKINTTNAHDIIDPLTDVLHDTMDLLALAEAKDIDVKHSATMNAKIVAVNKGLSDMKGRVATLVEPLMTEKNITKLKNCIDYLGNSAFITAVVSEEQYAEERKVMIDNLTLVANTAHRVAAKLPCSSAGCSLPRALPEEGKGGFKGSKLCPAHHLRRYQGLIDNPGVQMWLADNELRNLILPFLEESKLRDALELSMAIEGYAASDNASLRKTRGNAIFKKYIDSKLVTLPADEVKAISDSIADRTDAERALPKALFHPLMANLRSQFDEMFQNSFLPSTTYKNWVASVTLPAAQVPSS